MSKEYPGKCMAPLLSALRKSFGEFQRAPQPVRAMTIAPAGICPWTCSQSRNVLHGDLIVGIALHFRADVEHHQRTDQPLGGDCVHCPQAAGKMSGCVNVGAKMFGQRDRAGEILVLLDGSHRFGGEKETWRRLQTPALGRLSGGLGPRPPRNPLGSAVRGAMLLAK